MTPQAHRSGASADEGLTAPRSVHVCVCGIGRIARDLLPHPASSLRKLRPAQPRMRAGRACRHCDVGGSGTASFAQANQSACGDARGALCAVCVMGRLLPSGRQAVSVCVAVCCASPPRSPSPRLHFLLDWGPCTHTRGERTQASKQAGRQAIPAGPQSVANGTSAGCGAITRISGGVPLECESRTSERREKRPRECVHSPGED